MPECLTRTDSIQNFRDLSSREYFGFAPSLLSLSLSPSPAKKQEQFYSIHLQQPHVTVYSRYKGFWSNLARHPHLVTYVSKQFNPEWLLILPLYASFTSSYFRTASFLPPSPLSPFDNLQFHSLIHARLMWEIHFTSIFRPFTHRTHYQEIKDVLQCSPADSLVSSFE